MPNIHPSETPPLGWLVPCLAVDDLSASLDYYAKLDLLRYGGSIDEGWAMLRNRAIEVHLFQGHIPRDLLNFRGADVRAVRAALSQRGLEVSSVQSERSFTYLDPDGREVFFDTSDEEREDYAAGKPLTGPIPEDDVHEGPGLDLGNLTWCCACESLAATSGFYRTLGLVRAGGEPARGFEILARPDHLPRPGRRVIATYLSLFEGHIPGDAINLRGGNVGAIGAVLEERGMDLGEGVTTGDDGGESLLLTDPDGHTVFLDTMPAERLYDS